MILGRRHPLPSYSSLYAEFRISKVLHHEQPALEINDTLIPLDVREKEL